MRKLGGAFIYFLLLISTLPCQATLKVQEITTPGGLKAWFVENKDTPVISLSFAFKAGSGVDPQGKEGVASLSAAMLLEGAGTLDKQALSGKLQDLAITISYSASVDLFFGQIFTLKEHQEEAVQLLNMTLTQSLLKDASLELLKSQALTSLANIAQDPSYLAQKTLMNLLYHSHPYGRPSEGTMESIPKIGVQEIKGYLKSYLAHDNLIIGITGNLTAAQASALLDKAFRDLPKKAKAILVPPLSIQAHNDITVIEQDIPQSTIFFAQEGLKANDPDLLKASVLLQILGEGSIARLNEEIREKRGLAYYAYCQLSPSAYAGLILGSIGTVNSHAKESLALTRTQFRLMHDHGVTLKELNNAKQYLIGSFPLRFPDSPSVSNLLVQFQYAKKGTTYFEERTAKINAVTLEEINELAKRLLKPDALTFVVVGKPSGIPSLKDHPLKGKN